MDKQVGSKVDGRRKDGVKFRMPKVGETLEKYGNGLNDELLARGRLDFIKYQESVKGQLTQEQFDLVRSSALTAENLMSTSDKLHSGNIETKFLLLKRRFYVDADGTVRDFKCDDTVVCEPESLFDLIMCGHLKNGHIHWRRLHHYLRRKYANTTRAFAQICVRYCSECNPEEVLRPYRKFRHTNIYSGLLPLERVHVEIIAPFPKLIEGLYSHVLYLRDYYSRFVWMQPLASERVSEITKAFLTFLLSLPRVPIFVETSTLKRQDLFEVCENIASQYGLSIGLGMSRSTTFQRNGVERLRYLLQQNEEPCLKSWHMCLKFGVTNHNMTYNARVLGLPGNLLHSTVSDYGRQFELKREELIEKLFASNVVELRNEGRRRGMIYLEDESSAFKMPDEEYISAENETENEGFDYGPMVGLTPLTSPSRHDITRDTSISPSFSPSSPAFEGRPSQTPDTLNMSREISGPPSFMLKGADHDQTAFVNGTSMEL